MICWHQHLSAWAPDATLAPLRRLLVESESVQLEPETSQLWFHKTGICKCSASHHLQLSQCVWNSDGDWHMHVQLHLHLRALLNHSGSSEEEHSLRSAEPTFKPSIAHCFPYRICSSTKNLTVNRNTQNCPLGVQQPPFLSISWWVLCSVSICHWDRPGSPRLLSASLHGEPEEKHAS